MSRLLLPEFPVHGMAIHYTKNLFSCWWRAYNLESDAVDPCDVVESPLLGPPRGAASRERGVFNRP